MKGPKKVGKRLQQSIDDNQQWFLPGLQSLQSKKLKEFSSKEVASSLEQYLLTKELLDPGTMTKTGLPEVDYTTFLIWLRNQVSFQKALDDQVSRELSLDQYYQYLLKRFEKEGPEKPKLLLSIFQRKVSRQYKTALEEAQNKTVRLYDQLVSKNMDQYQSEKEFIQDLTQAVSQFRLIEPNFRHLDFMRWLHSSGAIENLMHEGSRFKKLGDFVKAKYIQYAPYVDPNEKTFKDKILKLLGKKSDLEKKCAKNDACYASHMENKIKSLVKGKNYAGKFSCLAKNPTVINTTVVDLVIAWSMMTLMFKNNQENFERFPWEVIASGITFAPMIAEANCRASFKGHYSFGETVGEMSHRKLKNKIVFASKNLGNLAQKSFYGVAGFVAYTYAFDQLYGALGHPIEKPKSLTDHIKTLPFLFLYGGVWNNLKGLFVYNPIRYKLIPAFAGILEQKFRIHGLAWFANTGLNAGAKFLIEYYQSWEFLKHYRRRIMPMLMGMVGLEMSTEEKEGKAVQVLKKDPQSKIKVKERVLSVVGDPQIKIYQNSYSNGIVTKVIIRHTFVNGKEMVEIIDMDIEMSEELIHQHLDSMIDQASL